MFLLELLDYLQEAACCISGKDCSHKIGCVLPLYLPLDSWAQEALVCKMESSSIKKRLCDIDFPKSLQERLASCDKRPTTGR